MQTTIPQVALISVIFSGVNGENHSPAYRVFQNSEKRLQLLLWIAILIKYYFWWDGLPQSNYTFGKYFPPQK